MLLSKDAKYEGDLGRDCVDHSKTVQDSHPCPGPAPIYVAPLGLFSDDRGEKPWSINDSNSYVAHASFLTET